MKELKTRIKSVKITRKITKAMQLVSTAHLRKAREQNLSIIDGVGIIDNIIAGMEVEDAKLLPPIISGRTGLQKHMLIVCTSNRGLCGAFNASIARFVKSKIENLRALNKEVLLYVIGKRGYLYLRRAYPECLVPSTVDITSNGIISLELASDIADEIIEMFVKEKFDSCDIIYNFPESTSIQVPVMHGLIPVSIAKNEKPIRYEFDSDYHDTIEYLAKEFIRYKLYLALTKAMVSEHSARMSAMDNATRNSDALLKKLNLVYNRTRQQHITSEIIEIISGSEAV